MDVIFGPNNVFQPTREHPPRPLGGTRVRKQWSALICTVFRFFTYYIQHPNIVFIVRTVIIVISNKQIHRTIVFVGMIG